MSYGEDTMHEIEKGCHNCSFSDQNFDAFPCSRCKLNEDHGDYWISTEVEHGKDKNYA